MRAPLGTLRVAAVATLLVGLAVVAVRAESDRQTARAFVATRLEAGDSPLEAIDVLVAERDRRAVETEVAAPTTLPPTTTPPTAPPAPATTAAPPAPAPTVAAAPDEGAIAAAAPAPGPRFTLDPYRGLGAWIDVYDWSMTFTNGAPGVNEPEIDRMASLGVRTIYIQASHNRTPDLVLEEARLRTLIDRAHADGMRVVAWYLPTLADPGADLYRLAVISDLPVDGLGVDIESRVVPDVATRNQALVWLSRSLRELLPGEALSAIVIPPVQMEDVNPNFWPGFPWAELAPYYDVWQPMAYWTERRSDSPWRDGYTYIATNIDRIRANIGRPDAAVHPVGGIATDVTVEHLGGMLQASVERGALGGSLYDYRTTGDHLWQSLLPFNG